MDPNTKIKFSRNGVEIGEFKLWEIEVMVKTFKILSTDHYWHEGMTQWEPVTKLIEIINKLKLDEDTAKREREEEVERTKREVILAEYKRSNFFTCNCCRHVFEEPVGLSDRLSKGISIVFVSCLVSFSILYSVSKSFATAAGNSDDKFLIILFGFISVVLWIIGHAFILSAFVRAPSCPQCGSSNFARPQRPELSSKK